MSCNGMSFFPANFMLQTSLYQQDEDDDTHLNHNQNHHHHQDQHPIFPPQDFNGVAAFLGGKRSSMHHLSGMEQQNGCGDTNNNNTNTNTNNNAEDELSDDGSLDHQKKKRLNMEQVKTLEKSFEMGNKLEPDRKVQLARALGLQPRQIAIWFQNRRARWKTKQLEKDYDALKRQFDAVKAQTERLQSQNQKLQSRIQALTSGREGAAGNVVVVATDSFSLNKETVDQGSCSNRSENETEINMVKTGMSTTGGGGTGTKSPGQILASMPLFPTSSSTNTNSQRLNSSSNLSATQLFFHHNQNQQPQEQQLQHNNVKDDNFSNMFCGIEDHSGFWPWLEQQQQQQQQQQQHFN